MIGVVVQLVEGGYKVRPACGLVGVPRSTFCDRKGGRVMPDPLARSRKDSVQPHALTVVEVEQIRDVLSDPVHEPLSVVEAYWTAFDAGVVDCSQRSFYRVANRFGLVGDRRPTRAGGQGGRTRPCAAATKVNELWSWDVSEFRGPGRQRYQLFLAMDVYSRYPVGWRLEHDASRHHAVGLFTDAFARHGMPHVLHADNGTQMRSNDLRNLLGEVRVTTSYSRPRVSDDNPFSEALFKTIKYDLAMPDYFDSLDHARASDLRR